MEQNSLQLNNFHESDFSGFINNLQQPTNTYEMSAMSDTLSDINGNTATQCNICVNNNQQHSDTMAASTYPALQYDNLPQDISNVAPPQASDTMAALTYPALQYDNLPQDISNVAPPQYATASDTMAASTYSAPQCNNLPQYISNIAPPQYATSSGIMAASTYSASQYDNLPQDISPAPQHNNLSQYVSPVPQLVLLINSPTMTVYESLDYNIILVPKCLCPFVDSNNFNRQD